MLFSGCSTSTCPSVACRPEIHLTYNTAIQAAYSVSATVAGNTFAATCPLASGTVPGISSCDSSGLIISGVDLGHGDNSVVDLTLTLNGGAAIDVKATLSYVTNSRDCDLVCYVHTGTVQN